MINDLSIIIRSQLDQSSKSINSFNKELKEFSKKLKPLSISIDINKTKVSDINRQIKELNKNIKPIKIVANVDNKEIEKTRAAHVKLGNTAKSNADKIRNAEQQTNLKLKEQVALYKQKIELQLRSTQASYKSQVNNIPVQNEINNIKKNLSSLDGLAPKAASARMKEINMSVKTLNTGLKETKVNAEGGFNEFAKNTKKMLMWAAAGTAIFGTVRAIRSAISTITQLDTSIVNLKKVTDETEESYDKFLKTANSMAIEVGHSSKAAIDATTSFAKLNYSIKESAELAKQALIYSNIGDIGIDEATESIISTLKGFNLEISETAHLIDAANEVGKFIAA